MGRIKELDGLRAIAILAVVLSHFTPPDTRGSNLLYLGWSGVDLFFAISGFLITGILIDLRQKETPFRTFYWRRTLRIFPPYYLALTFVLILAFVHKEFVPYGVTLRHCLFLSSATPGLIKLAVSRVLFHAYPVVASSYPSVTESTGLQFKDCLRIYWSVSVEELFYLLWAPVVLMGTRRMLLVCSVAPLFFCPVLRSLAHTTPHIDETFGFVFRFDSLAAGGCVALLFWSTHENRWKQWFIERGLISTTVLSSLALLLLTRFCGVFRGVDVRTTWAFSAFGYSLLAILCASVVGNCARWSRDGGFVSRVLRSRMVVYVGTISYTIYLIHLPIYFLIRINTFKFFGESAPATKNGWTISCAILAAVCTVLLAGLSWRYFETPILRLKEKQFPIRKGRPSPLSAAETVAL